MKQWQKQTIRVMESFTRMVKLNVLKIDYKNQCHEHEKMKLISFEAKIPSHGNLILRKLKDGV